MMKKIALPLSCFLLFAPVVKTFAQDDIEKILEQQEQKPVNEKVFATFKTSQNEDSCTYDSNLAYLGNSSLQ